MSRRRRCTLAATAVLTLLLALTSTPAPADELTLVHVPSTQFTFSPGAGAAVGSATVLWSRGAASAYVTSTSTVRNILFEAHPQPCEGSPHLEVAADNVTRFSQELLAGPSYPGDLDSSYAVPVNWPPGRHKLTFRFLDDHLTATCDRNLRLSDIQLSGLPDVYTTQWLPPSGVEVRPVTAGETGGPSRPWSGLAKLWHNGSLRFRLNSNRAQELHVGFIGTLCGGRSAHVRVVMDGEVPHDGLLPNPWSSNGLNRGTLELGRTIPDGVHAFTITMSEDLSTTTCDRNLVVDELIFHSNPWDWYPT